MQCGKMENYTRTRVVLGYSTRLYISEEELTAFKLSGAYQKIEYVDSKGRLHRTDGPAVEHSCGCTQVYVHGVFFSSGQHCGHPDF